MDNIQEMSLDELLKLKSQLINEIATMDVKQSGLKLVRLVTH